MYLGLKSAILAPMIVTRWQAPVVPDESQARYLFEGEGLTPKPEVLEAGTEIPDHRHPFDEIRMVVSGELMLNVAGTKLLLRAGDRIMIPANTKHSKKVEGTEPCRCICADRAF